jgi:hypothetical protein
MLKRTGFKRKAWPVREEKAERIKPVLAPLTRPARYASPSNDLTFTAPKENALQHEGYMAVVRKLPCARCGVIGFSQFCHSDEGKGMGIKTDCRRGWPGCGPHGDTMGCHYLLGSTGTMSRDERRRLEDEYAAKARAEIVRLGVWPKNLPSWVE